MPSKGKGFLYNLLGFFFEIVKIGENGKLL
jgi:hypothetical protein